MSSLNNTVIILLNKKKHQHQ